MTDEIYRGHEKRSADYWSIRAENLVQIFTHKTSTRKIYLSIDIWKVIDKTFLNF